VQVNPAFLQIANILKTVRANIDGNKNSPFSPDPWALQALWPQFMSELSFTERLSISQGFQHQGLEVLSKLFSVSYLLQYDTFTRSVFKTFEKKVMKNTLKTSSVDGFKYLIAFFVFLDNGPKLCFENDASQVNTEISGDTTNFSVYAIIEAMNLVFVNVADHSIDLDLLVYWINNLDLQDSASIRTFCELPLNEDEQELTLIQLKTPNDIRKFKERIFPKGPWYTTSALVFTSLIKPSINYTALLNKLIEVKRNNGFEGLKHVQVKESRLQTYFSGLRIMPEYQITVQRWIFTDLYEVGILSFYLDEHINDLRSLPINKNTAQKFS